MLSWTLRALHAIVLTLQGHLPLSFNIQCLWHFSTHVYRRCHLPVVTTLQWRNSVKSELGRGYRSELGCNPQILLRGEGNFAGLPSGSTRICHVLRVLAGTGGGLPSKEGREGICYLWVPSSTVQEAFTYMIWLNFQQTKYYSFLFRCRAEAHGHEWICQWLKVLDLNPLLNGSKFNCFL